MSPFAEESRRVRTAQAAWAATPLRDRLRVVRTFRHRLVDAVDAITAAVEADVNRPPQEVAASDVLTVAAAAKYLSQSASRVLKPRKARGTPLWLWGCRDVIHRRPWGVVGLIGTWNYPIFLNAVPMLQAFAAGNGVLWKPSEQAPRSAKVLQQLFADSGLPGDLLVMLPITREAGPELAEADIDFLHFTGSDTVGRKLAARLGERLIPSTLELSGVDAAIVLDDADIDLAVKAIWFGTTLNRGQTCMSTRRAFVAPSRLEEFRAKLAPLVQATPLAQLQTLGQVTQFNRLSGSDAVNPVPAAVIDATADAPVCHEASFSPLLAIIPLHDPVADHNQSAFGLSCAVFTKNPEAAAGMIANLRTGSVVMNDVIVPTANPTTPFGGRGASGWGLTQGDEGLLAMTVPQVVTFRGGRFRPHVDAALTQDPAAIDVTMGLLKLSHARSVLTRLRGLVQMIGGMRRSRRA